MKYIYKRTLWYYLIVFLLSLASFPSHAQKDRREGFVILEKGDTLTGWVDYRQGAKKNVSCSFASTKEASPITYTPQDILGYGFLNDRFFISKSIFNSEGHQINFFLQVLVDGKVDLFRSMDNYYVGDEKSIYLLKNEEKVKVIDGRRVMTRTREHVGVLSALMSDCEGFFQSINEVEIHHKHLTKLVEEYNTCVGSKPISYEASKPWLRIEPGIVGGVLISNLKFTSSSQGFRHLTSRFQTAYSFVTGLSTVIYSPRIHEGLAADLSILYTDASFVTSQVNDQHFYTEYLDVNIQLEQLKIPIGIRYSIAISEFKYYFNTAVSTTFNLSSDTKLTVRNEQPGISRVSEQVATQIHVYQLGLWGGIGISRTLGAELSGFIELRFERTNGVTNTLETASLYSNINNLQLTAGISLQ